MTISRINVGNIANDGTGDDLRQAFVKVNNNFDELDLKVVPQNTAHNLGAGEGVFYTKENHVLNFRSLVAGDNIVIGGDATSITITNPGNLTLTTDGETLSLSGASRQFGVNGGQSINTSLAGNSINVALDPTNLVSLDTNPALGGALDAGSNNINNVNSLYATTVNATSVVGALTGTVNGVDVTEIGRIVDGIDYGLLSDNITTGLEILLNNTTVDYGTVTVPGALNSNYGAV
jgi:hypothetical protein|tara:strand:+ start:1336 stop:2037 length:702 start_codon:yes stop_codon:yes gene_type:complete